VVGGTGGQAELLQDDMRRIVADTKHKNTGGFREQLKVQQKKQKKRHLILRRTRGVKREKTKKAAPKHGGVKKPVLKQKIKGRKRRQWPPYKKPTVQGATKKNTPSTCWGDV